MYHFILHYRVCILLSLYKSFSVSDACVKVEADGTPKVFWANAWRPICGHWFWDNNNGAKSVCQRIGYSNGVLSRTNGAYFEDAIRLGRCNSNEDLLSCSSGCRDKGIGNGCSSCGRGNRVAIRIYCSGMVAGTEINSCDGIYLLQMKIDQTDSKS